MLDTNNSEKNENKQQQQETQNLETTVQSTDLQQIKMDLSRNNLVRTRTSQRINKKRILRATSELDVQIKEGIELLEFFRDENENPQNNNNRNNKINIINTVSSQNLYGKQNNNNNNNSNNSKTKTTKFRAEVLYYPIIHGDLRRTEMQFKSFLPNKEDIETEREAALYREGRRVYVPANRSKAQNLIYKNYTQYNK